jgi:hypothetical protein
MNLSDMVGHKQASEGDDPLNTKIDFMNMRRLKPGEPLTERRPFSVQASNSPEYERGIDSLIRGLVDLLPKRDGIWSLDDRAKWLRLAAGIFDLGYKATDGEHREISVALVKPKSSQTITH